MDLKELGIRKHDTVRGGAAGSVLGPLTGTRIAAYRGDLGGAVRQSSIAVRGRLGLQQLREEHLLDGRIK